VCFCVALSQERNTLWEVCETPGLLALLPHVLNRRPGADDMEQRILQFRAAASAAAAAAASGVRSSGSETAVQQQQEEQERQLVEVDDSGLPAGMYDSQIYTDPSNSNMCSLSTHASSV
jgi:hypothetical protein